jgi:malate dehydrogenase
MKPKVSIIGAGMTGSTTMHWLAAKEIADLVLVDIVEGLPQGKALDMQESLPVIVRDVTITGSNSYEATADSDVVVITAGKPRTPGMSRDDLLSINAKIVGDITEKTVKLSPKAIFIVLTNPLDAMAYVVMKKGNLPSQRVIGQAGVLDSSRMRAFVAMETGVSVENINCYVLGGHGDDMVPLTRHSNVAGVPLEKMIGKKKLDEIIERTRKGGAEIVNLLKNGSAFYAPGAAVAQMVEAVIRDRCLILPASAWLQGEYGLKDIFFGVPVQLSRNGIERIIEYDLNEDEMASINKSAEHVRETVAKLEELRY